MKNILGLFMLVAMVGFFTSCGDDEEVTNTELLTEEGWKAKKITALGGIASEDVEEVTFDFGATSFSHSPLEGDVVVGTWEFEENETQIHVTTVDGSALHFDITTLEEGTLIMTEETGTQSTYELEHDN